MGSSVQPIDSFWTVAGNIAHLSLFKNLKIFLLENNQWQLKNAQIRFAPNWEELSIARFDQTFVCLLEFLLLTDDEDSRGLLLCSKERFKLLKLLELLSLCDSNVLALSVVALVPWSCSCVVVRVGVVTMPTISTCSTRGANTLSDPRTEGGFCGVKIKI